MGQEFRSTKSLGFAAGLLLLANVAFDGLEFVLELVQRAYFPGIWFSQDDFLTDAEAFFTMGYFAALLASVAVFIAGSVVFLIWFKRSYENLEAFQVEGLSTTPGWAVGHWFIPFLWFYFPFKIMNEIYNGSDPDAGELRISNTSTGVIRGIWWGLWVSLSIIGNITLRISLNTEDPATLELAQTIDIIALPFWMICGLLAYRIVREVTSRQEAIGAVADSLVPPEPPVFGR